MSLYTNGLWRGGLWNNGLWNNGLWGTGRVNLTPYAFYMIPKFGITPKDLVSLQLMESVFSAGRVDDDGNEFGVNVPVVDSAGWLNSYGAYENLITYSEDISDSDWIKTRATIDSDVIMSPIGTLTAAKLKSDNTPNTSHSFTRTFSLTADTIYTISIWIKKAEFSWAGVYLTDKTGSNNFAFFNLENGVVGTVSGSASAIIAASIGDWHLCTVSYDTASGATTDRLRVYVGENDVDTSIDGTVTGQGIYIWGAQVTESPYRLPYVKTEASTVTVPQNYSDEDEGNKFPIGDGSECGQNLLNAFDGVADGDELIGNPDLETDDTGWAVLNADEVTTEGRNTTNPISGVADYKLAGTSEGTDNDHPRIIIDYASTPQLLGKYAVISFDYRVNSGTCTLITIRNGTAGTRDLTNHTFAGSGTHTTRLNFDDSDDNTQTFLQLYFNGTNEFEVQIDNVSVKQISPAEGELVLDWMPMFDAGDLTGNINILTGNAESDSFLFFDATNNLIKAYDGANTATVACSPTAGTHYVLKLVYGDNSGQKMQLYCDETAGSAVTHAGSFPNGDDLSFAWDASAWQKTKITKIYKELNSW